MIATRIVLFRSATIAARRSCCSLLPRLDHFVIHRRFDGVSFSDTSHFPRTFHASSIARFAAVRRRRRSGGDPGTSSDGQLSGHGKRRSAGGSEAHGLEYDVDVNDDGMTEKPRGIRHEADTDAGRFRRRSTELLDKLHAALAPLGPPLNDPFILVRGMEDGVGPFLLLDLGPVHGQYTLQVDEDDATVMLNSPLSGQIYYVLSGSTGEFCGLEDGHSLEGMMVRDLIRQIYGVPQL